MRSRVSCRASPCSVALFVVSFPICFCGAPRLRAAQCAVACVKRGAGGDEASDGASAQRMAYGVCRCWDTVWSAVQYVGTTDPTVLPIRKVPLALMYDPLDNHEIAFGVVHFALRFFP